MTKSTDTTSLVDFSTRLRDHLDERKATGRPLVITSDGEAEAVVLSPSAYDELASRADLSESLALLDRGAADVAAGRTRPAKAALRQIADDLRLPLDR
jgi:prevent-host-death family protein